MLVLINQRGQVLATAEAVLLEVATLAVVSLVAAPALRQLFTVAAFEEHRLSGVHTLPAEMLAE